MPHEASINRAWQRQLIGALAIGLLFVAGLMFSGLVPVENTGMAASFLRMGLVLGVLWLAWPDAFRPASLAFLGGLLALAFVLVKFPKQFPIFAGGAILLAILSARLKRRRR
ncbi:MAG: hypothetical protein JNM18_24575 [Planctomycetaceae bacterium]|nr:hypothetical protein [Planctomycetaceae bacterium]